MDPFDDDLDLMPHPPRPWHTDLPRVGGRLKCEPEDFRVDEELAYVPAGEGGHLYLRVRKRGMTTFEAINVVATHAGVSPRDVGRAGLKDRNAVTTQWLSVVREDDEDEGLVAAIEASDAPVTVVEAVRHPRKLKRGHVRRNRFELRVREVEEASEEVLSAWQARLSEMGFANHFGVQRFGREGLNVVRGRRQLLGRRRGKRLLLNALQSEVFNRYVNARLADEALCRVQAGDVLKRRETGGVFECEDVAVDQARLDAGELVVTGALPGQRVWGPEDRWWAGVVGSLGVTRAMWQRVGRQARGERRALVGWPEGLVMEGMGGGCVRVRMGLETGTYATVMAAAMGMV